MKISRLFSSVAILSALSLNASAELLIYYPLNESSGNFALDAALGNGPQDALSASTADWQTSAGILGGGLRFSPTGQNDVNEALIFNNSGVSIIPATPFTISLWMRTTDTGAFNHAAVFLGDPLSGSAYFAVGMNATLQPQLVARNTTAINTAGPTPANDGNWHQLTAVFSANNSRQFYFDGMLANSSTTNVNFPTTSRYGIGALTRNAQTDAYSGLLDEIGLFNTAFSAQQAALLNAFPRYDNVPLDDPDFDAAISIFNSQTGSVDTGDWTWEYASGLLGPMGSTGFDGGQPYVVLDGGGNGLMAVPEPALPAMLAAGALALLRRRQRAR
jgi:hypothetical protein